MKKKSYVGYMVECTQETLQSLQNKVNSGQTEVEIGEYMASLTADIISRTEFNTNYEKGKKIFHRLTILQCLCAQATRRLYLPGSRWVINLLCAHFSSFPIWHRYKGDISFTWSGFLVFSFNRFHLFSSSFVNCCYLLFLSITFGLVLYNSPYPEFNS